MLQIAILSDPIVDNSIQDKILHKLKLYSTFLHQE